jgi:hypothetical protein
MTNATKLNSVTLSAPLKIDGTEEKVISLRTPKAGELRGLKLTDLMQMDVQALMVVLPRITQPPLSGDQVASMSVVDLTRFGTKIIGFFGDLSAPEPEIQSH